MHDTRSPAARRAAAGLLLGLLCLPGVAAQPADPPLAPSAEGPDQTKLRRHGDIVHLFTGDVVVSAREERRGTVVCVGCDVLIEGEVSRDVVVVLGSLRVEGGAVGGQVVGVLSDMEMRNATVGDQLINVLGGLRRENVSIAGQVINLGFPGNWFPGVWALLTWFRVLGILFVFVLLVLLVALVPERVRLIGDEAPARYVAGFFVGVLAYIVLLVLAPLALATVVGFGLGWAAFVAFKWLAIAGMFHALGQRIGRALGREMSPLGAVLLIYAGYAAILLLLSAFDFLGLLLIGLVRTLFWLLFEIPAVGLVLLTRFGTRSGTPAVVLPQAAQRPPGAAERSAPPAP